MEQTTQQIETHIESTRDELGSNIYEFERKVKSVTDWRERFRKNPMLILSAAFSGGVLVASMISGRRNPKNESLYSRNAETAIKNALIGVAVARSKDYVAEVVPDFQEQYQKTEQAAKTEPI